MQILRYAAWSQRILSMKRKNVYIIDNITLFNPAIEEGKVLLYKDILASKIDWGLGVKIYFVTADIDSIMDITTKMQNIFLQLKAAAIILKDSEREKTITLGHLFLLILKKAQEEKYKDKIGSCVDRRLEQLERQNVRKKYRKDASPMYIKTTMSYGVQSGGMVAHSTGVLNALAKRYRQIEVYTTDYISDQVEIKNIHHISMKRYHDFSQVRKLYFNFSACHDIYRLQEKKIPAFVYQRCSLEDFIGLQVSCRYKVPFVLEFNSSEIWTAKYWGYGLQNKYLAERIERLNLNKADLIVCVSKALKESLIAQGIKSEKILVNYNGVDIDKYNPDISGEEIREKYGLQNKIVIGFSGSFGAFHGAEKLAESYVALLSKHKEYRNKISLLMIGEGKTLPEVKRTLKGFRMEDCANCVGSVPFEKMPSYLAACDILVAPHVPNEDGSDFFGSPTKLFEYMAMGKAIVASDLNQIGEILEDREDALLFEPGNIKDMSDKLALLVENAGLRKKLGQSARKSAVEKHTWDIHVSKIANKINELYGG